MALLAALLAITISSAQAGPIRLTEIPDRSLGTEASYLVEQGQPLALAQALALHGANRFQPGRQAMLNFGIGSRPVWVRLEVDNPVDATLPLYLVGGVSWLDRLDVYVVQSGQLQAQRRSGDETSAAPGLAPAMGYTVPLDFSPGRSEIYLRVESIDPMVLPVQLMSEDAFQQRRQFFGYFYGFVYGFLGALCIYNLLLFAGLRERSYLYYSLALGSFILCNLAYTGHGLAWIWPDQLRLQRYVILVWMVVFSAFGLLFASRFLSLAEYAPRALKAARWFCGFGLGVLAACVLAGSQLGAALTAFSFVSLFTAAMFLLGLLAVRAGRAAGRYFLAATASGLLGVATTALAVWGKIPTTPLTFHATELGFIVESTLLAMALTYRIRQYQQANLAAETMARQDPLTGLYNRRAFMELAAPCWSSAERGERPLSLIMMDIDHFKQINDQYGHQAGDAVLEEVADLLKKFSRSSDIVARWGGEEFILLLTETDLAQAASHAERLRQAITEIGLPEEGKRASLTASFGIAERHTERALDEMVHLADSLLYQAKNEGRNRVCCEMATTELANVA